MNTRALFIRSTLLILRIFKAKNYCKMRTYIYAIVCFLMLSGYNASAQCPAATPSLIHIQADSVSMAWAFAGAGVYEYAVLPASAAAPTTGTSTSLIAAGVGGLTPGMAYKAWHRTYCGASLFTPWISLSFSTPCGTPGTITITNAIADSADITWTSVSPGASYEYYIDTLSTTPTSGTAINTNTVRVKGLKPAKTYYAFARTSCGGTSYSAWAMQSFFTPWSVGVNEIATTTAINFYPNPAKDILYVNNNNAPFLMLVTDISGKTVLATEIHTGTNTINISSLDRGMYIIRYVQGEEVQIKKLLKD